MGKRVTLDNRKQDIGNRESIDLDTDMPFEFKRLQFPVRLAFAMSINKAQGQSLKVVGIRGGTLLLL